jgi:hypothetical protein
MAAPNHVFEAFLQRIWLVVAALLVVSVAALITSGVLQQLDEFQHQSVRTQLEVFTQTIGVIHAAFTLGAAIALTQAPANTIKQLRVLTWSARLEVFLAALISASALFQAIEPYESFPGGNARAGQIIGALSTLALSALALALGLAVLRHINKARQAHQSVGATANRA